MEARTHAALDWTEVVKHDELTKAIIGTMGDTGSPGAVHLHIELRPRGWSGGAQDAEPIIRKLCAAA